MRLRRSAIIILSLVVGMCAVPLAAGAQQAAVPNQAAHIEAARTFLMTWGHQQWDNLRTVASDKVTVTMGADSYTLDAGAQKSDVRLTLPFRGLSTVRTDGKITGVTVDEMVFKIGEREMRGRAVVDLTEENGAFRVTAVKLTSAQP
jgi:hypothetical protein